jgi:hypothetical protein
MSSRNGLSIAITYAAVGLLTAAVFFDTPEIIAAPILERTVEIEFDPVPNAKQYEVKVTSTSDPQIKPQYTILKGNLFSQKIPLGTWKIEVRAYDQRGVGGRWNPIGDVDVKFRTPKLLSPGRNSTLKNSPDEAVPVTFKWSTFSPDAQYSFVIKSTDPDTTIVDQKVTGGTFQYPLKQGSYTWTVTSNPPQGMKVEGTDPEPWPFAVNAGKLKDPVFEKPLKKPPESISWKSVPYATSYSVTLDRTTNEHFEALSAPESVSEKSTINLSEDIPANLKPGQYRIRVEAYAVGFEASRERAIQFKIPAPVVKETSAEIAGHKAQDLAKKPTAGPQPNHVPVTFVQASMGPVFWSYAYSSSLSQHFKINALTMTAISADVTKWFAKTPTSAWAVEVRGRQTNIILFPEEDPQNPGQSRVTVADRRLALIGRRRKIIDRVGVDAIFGFGSHHYTYLLQSTDGSIIRPVEGDLLEFYVGGAMDWQLKTGSHASFDLTFHPVGFSTGISSVKTLQYTATLRLLKPVLHERSFLALNFENIRSRVDTIDKSTTARIETISAWYRLGIGLAIKL